MKITQSEYEKTFLRSHVVQRGHVVLGGRILGPRYQ